MLYFGTVQRDDKLIQSGAEKMEKPNLIPGIVSIIAIILGCLDLVRGFMHTLLLQYAAVKIAGLDLSTGQAADLLRLMGSLSASPTRSAERH